MVRSLTIECKIEFFFDISLQFHDKPAKDDSSLEEHPPHHLIRRDLNNNDTIDTDLSKAPIDSWDKLVQLVCRVDERHDGTQSQS